MTQRRGVLLVLLMLLCAMLCGGCGQAQTPAETDPPSQAEAVTPTPEPEPEPVSTEVSITDVVGRNITLPAPATKLVGTHNPTLNQAVILGGGGKYIVGFGNKNMAGGLYGYVYPELDGVEQIGMRNEINFEACLAVDAELAILPERFADLAEQFEAVGIPAAVVLPNVESFDTIKSALRMVGALVGEDERAERIVAFFEEKIAAAKEIAATIEQQPAVLYLGGSSPLSVANGVMLQSTMIETVGAVNVAKDVPGKGDYIEVTLEEIIAWNPEVIYLPVFAQYTVDDVLNDPAWSSIKAVQDKKVFAFPSTLEPWDYPTPSAAMGLTWLIHSLYPDKYSIEQVVQDANEYYGFVYGQTFTAEQLGLE